MVEWWMDTKHRPYHLTTSPSHLRPPLLTATFRRAPGLQGCTYLHVPPPWTITSASVPVRR